MEYIIQFFTWVNSFGKWGWIIFCFFLFGGIAKIIEDSNNSSGGSGVTPVKSSGSGGRIILIKTERFYK